jgi:hypothetical protein
VPRDAPRLAAVQRRHAADGRTRRVAAEAVDAAPRHGVLALQRSFGNRAVTALLEPAVQRTCGGPEGGCGCASCSGAKQDDEA